METTTRSLSRSVAKRAAMAVAVAATLAASPVQAQSENYMDLRPVRFFIGGGLTAGGDRLATARYIDGSDYTLHAGGLLQFHGGLEFRLAQDLSLALSVGYHVDAADAWNGSIWFRRIPVEAIGHYRIDPHWRVGGGVRVALRPRLSSDGRAQPVEESFDTAVGPVIEVEYLFNPRLGLKLRGVSERYKSRSGLPTVNGDHVGVMLNFYF